MKRFALHIPEGVKDYIGLEAALKDITQDKVKKVFRSYSYNLVETPSFEYLDVFTLGEESFQQPSLYHLVSRQGELMALRSDMTRSIARVVGTQNMADSLPQRFCYLSNSFRYPERYQGKLHEFTQAGVELIGNKSREADAEVIKVAIECLKKAGVDDFTVHIGSSQFFGDLLNDLGLDEAYKCAVFEAIEKKDAVAVKKVLKDAKIDSDMLDVLMELIQCSGQIALLKSVKAKITSKKAKAALEEMEKLYEMLADDGVKDCLVFDFSLMSYGQYYTGVMFQIFTLGIGSALVEGGRYDHLLAQFGKDLPAVGFGMHINLVLQKLMKQRNLAASVEPRILVVCTAGTRGSCQKISDQKRDQGCIVENSLTCDLQDSLAYAKRAGMHQVMYFEQAEKVIVYDLEKGTMTEKVMDVR